MVCIFSGNCISIGPPPVVAQDNKGVKRLHNGNAMIISIFFWSNYLIIWKKGSVVSIRILQNFNCFGRVEPHD
jgi:hypothetical protein